MREIQEKTVSVQELNNNLELRRNAELFQQEIVTQLQKCLLSLLTENEELRAIAKPDFSKTMTWTMIELVAGLSPIPIPTTPLAHLIHWRRFMRTRKHDGPRTPIVE